MNENTPWERVLYAGNIRHSLVVDQVDEIKFQQPVRVTALRVVPLYVSDSKLSAFAGFTSPGSFNLEVYGVDFKNPKSCRFHRLCAPLTYEAPASDSFCVDLKPIVIDRLTLRGRYRTLSVILLGSIAELAPLDNCSFLWGTEMKDIDRSPSQQKSQTLNTQNNIGMSAVKELLPYRTYFQKDQIDIPIPMLEKIGPLLDKMKLNELSSEDCLELKKIALYCFPQTETGNDIEGIDKNTLNLILKIVCESAMQETSGTKSGLCAQVILAIIVCSDPSCIDAFSKATGFSFLLNQLEDTLCSGEVKLWSLLAILRAATSVHSIGALREAKVTLLEDHEENVDIESYLLSFAMRRENTYLAHLAFIVINHLQVYDALKSFQSEVIRYSSCWTSDTHNTDESLNLLNMCTAKVDRVLSNAIASMKMSKISNTSMDMRIKSYLEQLEFKIPQLDKIIILFLSDTKFMSGVAALLSMLSSIKWERRCSERIDMILKRICTILSHVNSLRASYALLIYNEGEYEVLNEVIKALNNKNMRQCKMYISTYLRQVNLTKHIIGQISCMKEEQDIPSLITLIQSITCSCYTLYNLGKSCSHVLEICVAHGMDILYGEVLKGIRGTTTKLSSEVAKAYIDYVYASLVLSDTFHTEFILKLHNTIQESMDMDPSDIPHSKKETLRSILSLASKCELREIETFLMKHIESYESDQSLESSSIFGVTVGLKVFSSRIAEVSFGSLESANLNLANLIHVFKCVLDFVARQMAGISQHEMEGWKAHGNVDDYILCEAYTQIIYLFDACLIGAEAFLTFLSVNKLESDIADLGKGLVAAFKVVPAWPYDFGDSLSSKLSSRYCKILRTWSLSTLKPTSFKEILRTPDEAVISFSVGKYLQALDLVSSMKMTALILNTDTAFGAKSCRAILQKQIEDNATGVISILSQTAYFSSPYMQSLLIEFCTKISYFGASAAKTVHSTLLEFLQQEYEVMIEDSTEVKCTINLAHVIQELSKNPLCKSVLLSVGCLSAIISVFKQPLLVNEAVTNTSLPLTVLQIVHNLCNIDISLTPSNPDYVKSVEDSPTVDEGSTFVSTMLNAMRSLSDKATSYAISILEMLSNHIPGKAALRNGASQWKTEAYWAGEGIQSAESVNATDALASAARFLRSMADNCDSETKTASLNKGASIFESQDLGLDEEDEEEPPQPTDLDTRFLKLQEDAQEFVCPKNLRFSSMREEDAKEGWLVLPESEIEAQNRWFKDEKFSRTLHSRKLEEELSSTSHFGDDTQKSKQNLPTGDSKGLAPGTNVEENGMSYPGDSMHVDYPSSANVDPVSGVEEDLYAELAPPSETAPSNANNGDDLYGDLGASDAMDLIQDTSNQVPEVHEQPAPFQPENLTPEAMMTLLKNPEQLPALLEKHPRLLAVLQQTLNK